MSTYIITSYVTFYLHSYVCSLHLPLCFVAIHSLWEGHGGMVLNRMYGERERESRGSWLTLVCMEWRLVHIFIQWWNWSQCFVTTAYGNKTITSYLYDMDMGQSWFTAQWQQHVITCIVQVDKCFIVRVWWLLWMFDRFFLSVAMGRWSAVIQLKRRFILLSMSCQQLKYRYVIVSIKFTSVWFMSTSL